MDAAAIASRILCLAHSCPTPRRTPTYPPMQERGAGDDEEAGFRIGGGGERAKGGLEVVHVLQGLGPPAHLDDGSAGVAPHPGAPQPPGFAAAAKAEHNREADAFKRLLLSRGAP